MYWIWYGYLSHYGYHRQVYFFLKVCVHTRLKFILDGTKRAELSTTNKNPIKKIEFHPMNYPMMICNSEDELTLWDTTTYQSIIHVAGIESVGLLDVCFTQDGKYLIALLKFQHIVIWKLEGMIMTFHMEIPGDSMLNSNSSKGLLNVSSDDRYLIIIYS